MIQHDDWTFNNNQSIDYLYLSQGQRGGDLGGTTTSLNCSTLTVENNKLTIDPFLSDLSDDSNEEGDEKSIPEVDGDEETSFGEKYSVNS